MKNINSIQGDLIEGVTFKSFGLWQYDVISQTRVGSIPFVAGGRWNGVYGIERNFLDVAYEGFYVERERVPLKSGGTRTMLYMIYMMELVKLRWKIPVQNKR